MYITKVVLENVRCFEKLEIDFEQRGSSILFLGDNGDGKSTILKSIAMGLCDESSAAALFRELPGDFVRRMPGQQESRTGDTAKIKIDFAGDDRWTYRIITTITSLDKFERVSQRGGLSRFKGKGNKTKPLDQDSFPWDKIFASGYGAGLRVQGSADFQHYLAVDAVYPLFKYDEPLQNPELVIRRLVEAARGIRKVSKTKRDNAENVLDAIKSLLASFLDLKKRDQIILTETGIKVKERWGTSELGELGDGYRATVTWVLDLLAWWFLKSTGKDRLNVTNIHGIVMFDEVEQHLHPRWQRRIFPLLQNSFPNIQFIATSHSPLVASGSEDIDVHVLNFGQHNVEKPYGWLAEDVYSMMGVKDTRPKKYIDDVLNAYEKLYKKQLEGKASKIELQKLKQLRKEISLLPESDPVSLTTEIKSITESLRKLTKRRCKK